MDEKQEGREIIESAKQSVREMLHRSHVSAEGRTKGLWLIPPAIESAAQASELVEAFLSSPVAKAGGTDDLLLMRLLVWVGNRLEMPR